MITFSTIDLLVTKKASGKPGHASISTHLFRLPRLLTGISNAPGVNDESVLVRHLFEFDQIVLIFFAFSACECRVHRICSDGFCNGVSVLRYARHAREPGSRQVHQGPHPRSARHHSYEDAREGCVSRVSDFIRSSPPGLCG